MPRHWCDYCEVYLPTSSKALRAQHEVGLKHKQNVRARHAIWTHLKNCNYNALISAGYTTGGVPRPTLGFSGLRLPIYPGGSILAGVGRPHPGPDGFGGRGPPMPGGGPPGGPPPVGPPIPYPFGGPPGVGPPMPGGPVMPGPGGFGGPPPARPPMPGGSGPPFMQGGSGPPFMQGGNSGRGPPMPGGYGPPPVRPPMPGGPGDQSGSIYSNSGPRGYGNSYEVLLFASQLHGDYVEELIPGVFALSSLALFVWIRRRMSYSLQKPLRRSQEPLLYN